ncbi:MAG: helix-turn-helix transcriptional regulator [Chloroflexi bacterium]|nr:helix-turn-helix transcriptional regulator [Chloroflexota bacterium]
MQNRIKVLRQERGLSQFALGKLADITPTDISRIENGMIHPYPGWRKRLAEALGVPEKELFPEEAKNERTTVAGS